MKIITKYFILLSICFASQTGNAQLDREWLNNYSTADTAYMNVIGLFDAGNGNVLKATLVSKYTGSETFNRLLLRKIAPSGMTIWEETYEHPQYDQFYLKSGGIDQNGNTYFSGHIVMNQAESNWFVISFDANGQERWQSNIVENLYSSGGSQFCITDNNGNTYVSGNVNDGGFSIGTIVKYDQAGNEEWVKYDADNYAYGADMIVAANGDLIACDGQYELTRFAPDGELLWNTPDTAEFLYVMPQIAEAPDGSIYAISFLGYNYSLKKLNANGVFQWNYNQFAEYLAFGDISVDVNTDSQNFIYLSGINSTDQNEYQSAVFKFTPNGDEVWRQELSPETYDVTDLLLLDNDQPVIASSNWDGSAYHTAVYLLNGQNGDVIDDDTLSAAGTEHHLMYNEAGLYLAGTGNFSTALARYDNTLAISDNDSNEQVLVYPNPFTDEIMVQSSLGNAVFECSDLSGKVVRSGILGNGSISLYDLAPGMYNLTIRSNSGSAVTKRIVKS